MSWILEKSMQKQTKQKDQPLVWASLRLLRYYYFFSEVLLVITFSTRGRQKWPDPNRRLIKVNLSPNPNPGIFHISEFIPDPSQKNSNKYNDISEHLCDSKPKYILIKIVWNWGYLNQNKKKIENSSQKFLPLLSTTFGSSNFISSYFTELLRIMYISH